MKIKGFEALRSELGLKPLEPKQKKRNYLSQMWCFNAQDWG